LLINTKKNFITVLGMFPEEMHVWIPEVMWL